MYGCILHIEAEPFILRVKPQYIQVDNRNREYGTDVSYTVNKIYIPT